MKNLSIALLFALISSAALANGGGHGGPGGPGPGDFGDHGGGGALVAADGTIFLVSTVRDSATNTSTTTLKAISPSGSAKWSVTLTNPGRLVLSGSNLLSVNDSSDSSTASSTITAISISSGATAWTQTIPGRVQDLIPFNGGTYAVVVTPAATTGGTATRSLVAISDAGAVLWTITV